MSNLKSRVAKLENIANPKEYGGIVIYHSNAVREENEAGLSEIVSADYYLENNDEGEPLTDAELEKALEGRTYICHLPVQDKRPQYVEINSK